MGLYVPVYVLAGWITEALVRELDDRSSGLWAMDLQCSRSRSPRGLLS